MLRKLSRLTALAALVLVASPAAARQAPEIIDGWFTDLLSAGADTAEHGKVVQDGDVTSVQDVDIKNEWQLELSDKKVTVTLDFRTDRIGLTGLSETAERFSATRISLADGSSISLAVHISDPSDTSGEPKVLHVREVLDGYEMEKVDWPRFDIPPLDPEHRVSSIFSGYKKLLDFSIEKVTLARLTVTRENPDGRGSSAIYSDFALTDVENGHIASYSLGGIRGAKNMNAPNGQPVELTLSGGAVTLNDVDIKPLLRAFDGRLYDASLPDTVIGDLSVQDVSITVPAQKSAFTIDRISAHDLTARPVNTDLVPILDKLATGTTPSAGPEKLMRAAAGVYGALSIGEADLSGLKIDAVGTRIAQLDRAEITDLSRNGLAALLIEGVGVSDLMGNSQLGISRFILSDLTFPSLDAILALKDARANGDLKSALKAIPTLGRIEIADATVIDGRHSGSASLERYRLMMDEFIGPIPTRLRSTLENLSIPASYADDPQARAVFAMLGLDELGLSEDISLRWDDVTEELELERANIALKNGGRATMNMTLGGIPRYLFEDPERAREVIASLSLKRATLTIEDATALTRMIELQADKSGLSPAILISGMGERIRNQLGPLAGPDFANQMAEAAKRFMADPRKLEIRLEPKNPVLAVQLMALAATAPQSIPALLGATASAD